MLTHLPSSSVRFVNINLQTKHVQLSLTVLMGL